MRIRNKRFVGLLTTLSAVLLCGVITAAATQTVLFEAEDAVSDGPPLDTAIPGYSGTGSRVFNAGVGTGIDFTVYARDAGYYDLTIRYNSKFGHKDNHIIVNGFSQLMNFDWTGDTEWRDLELPYFLELNAGKNTIRIQHQWGYIYVDYILVGGFPITAENPIPAMGQTVDPELSQLCWTNPAPSTPGHTVTADVYFGTTVPNRSLSNYGLTPIATGTTQTCVTLPYALDMFTTYYWVVDCWDLQYGSPTVLRGYSWEFNTGNQTPVASAGYDQYVWLGNDGTPGVAAVTLNGSASTDDGFPVGTLNYLWQQVNGPAGVPIHPYDASITQVALPVAGTYAFRLIVDDTDLQDSATVLVYVFESRCELLKDQGIVVLDAGDIDGDCFVGLEDLLAMLGDWLECNSLMPCN